MRRLFLFLGLLFCAAPAYAVCSGGESPAGTWNPATWAEVQDCHDEAGFDAGDTILLPSGTLAGSSTFTATKAFILKGAGCTYGTIGTVTNIPTSCSTVVTDDQAANPLISVAVAAATTSTRITQIQFEDNGRTSLTPIYISGSDSRSFRVDHVRFIDMPGGSGASIIDLITTLRGRFDHNFFSLPTDRTALYFRNATSYAWADARWTAATAWGGEDFVFIETNRFEYPAMADHAPVDAFGGARYVFRFNDVFNGWIEAHGSESGRSRGTRAVEAYMNTLDFDHSVGYLLNLRSGTSLTWGNTVTDAGGQGLIHYVQGRGLGNYDAFALSAGTNVWDINDGGNPQSICGGTTCTVASAAGSGGTYTVDVTSAGWTPDQWVGYHIKKVGCDDNNRPCGGVISDNDTDTITFQTDDEAFWNPNFAMGETFTVNLITHGMDMPCRSGGTMSAAVEAPAISMSASGTTVSVTWSGVHGFSTGLYVDFFGQVPSDVRGTYAILTGVDCTPDCANNELQYTLPATVSGAVTYAGGATPKHASWNDQVTDPCYQWLNLNDGSNATGGPQLSALDMRANEHYFEYVAPASFDGTVGVSSGARADRDASTTNGVAWWSTDQGGDWWVGGGDSQDGCLDIVVSVAWSNCVYTPATYDPASLEEGGGSGAGVRSGIRAR